MRMVTASAPGKIILFGEHAVVYGEPSLAGAIGKRTFVNLEKRGDGKITINSNVPPHYISVSLDELKSEKGFPYVVKAIELSFERIGKQSGLSIEIPSEIPVASGLGSSASVSIATILAIHKAMGRKISNDELAKLGHKVEISVQGAASPTDTLITTFGGVLFIEPEKQKYQRIDASIPLVVGATGIERSTKVLIENVRTMREKMPDVINPIIRNIGEITRRAKEVIEEEGDIGELMNVNHGLLSALGVSNLRLESLVFASLEAGASGAKLTGAGGGGCMIAYAPGNHKKVAKAIEEYRCTAFESEITTEGARIE